MEPSNFQEKVDKNWTLFLDRDGVINIESVGSYITQWSDFKFHDGVLKALNTLSNIFGTIVVVSNQRGVGRGIMEMSALREISHNMVQSVAEAGGIIHKAYSCIAVSDDDHNRKPNVGMALQAKEDFPGIDFRRSVMIGNSISDMEFGKRLAMHTVFLTTKHAPYELPHNLIDEQYDSLQAWTKSLSHAEVV